MHHLTWVALLLCLPSQASTQEAATEDTPSFLESLLNLPGRSSSRGELAVESRAFLDDDNDATEDQGVGIFGRLEVNHKHKPFQQRVRLYGRLDAFDNERTTFVVEEAWLQFKKRPIRLRVGLDVLNWTATEAFHPADIINARNLDSDLENLEKLGEPMTALQLRVFKGTITAYYMPYYSELVLPSPRSRLNPIPPKSRIGRRRLIDRDGAFTTDDFGHQGAIRIRQTIGPTDISLHAVHHMDRSQPIIGINFGSGRARPIFQTVTQVGGTYLHVIGPTILKLEGSYRIFAMPPDGTLTCQSPPPGAESLCGKFEDRDHGTLAAGIEYGVVHENGAESVLIVEGQAILGATKRTRVNLSPFQRDLLVGYRLAFNDLESRELLLLGIVDLEREEEFMAAAAYRQRLGETWSANLSFRVVNAFIKRQPANGLESLRNSDLVRLVLTRHF